MIDNKTIGIGKTTESCIVEEEQELSNVEWGEKSISFFISISSSTRQHQNGNIYYMIIHYTQVIVQEREHHSCINSNNH